MSIKIPSQSEIVRLLGILLLNLQKKFRSLEIACDRPLDIFTEESVRRLAKQKEITYEISHPWKSIHRRCRIAVWSPEVSLSLCTEAVDLFPFQKSPAVSDQSNADCAAIAVSLSAHQPSCSFFSVLLACSFDTLNASRPVISGWHSASVSA